MPLAEEIDFWGLFNLRLCAYPTCKNQNPRRFRHTGDHLSAVSALAALVDAGFSGCFYQEHLSHPNGYEITRMKPSPLVTHLLPAFIICADLFAIGFYLNIGLAGGDFVNRDFVAFYAAAQLPYRDVYDLEKQRAVELGLGRERLEVFVNPPFLLPLLKSLPGGYEQSFKLWIAILAAVAACCGVLIFSILTHCEWSMSRAAFASFTAILSLPLYLSVIRGQLTVFMLLGALLSIWLLQRNREALAGVASSLCFVKPHTALLMAMALKRSKAARYLFAALCVLAVFSVVLVGRKGIADLTHLAGYVSEHNGGGASQVRMFNFLGVMLRLGVPFGWAKGAAWLAFGIAIVVAVLIPVESRDPLRTSAIYIVLAVAFSPHLHIHDFGLLAVPALAVADNLNRRSLALGVVLLPLLPLLPFVMFFLLPD